MFPKAKWVLFTSPPTPWPRFVFPNTYSPNLKISVSPLFVFVFWSSESKLIIKICVWYLLKDIWIYLLDCITHYISSKFTLTSNNKSWKNCISTTFQTLGKPWTFIIFLKSLEQPWLLFSFKRGLPGIR